MKHRIDTRPEWRDAAHALEDGGDEKAISCLGLVRRHAIDILRKYRFVRILEVESLLNAEKSDGAAIALEAEAADSKYLEALDRMEGEATPEVLSAFAIARALTALMWTVSAAPLVGALEGIYELAVVSAAESAALLSAVSVELARK